MPKGQVLPASYFFEFSAASFTSPRLGYGAVHLISIALNLNHARARHIEASGKGEGAAVMKFLGGRGVAAIAVLSLGAAMLAGCSPVIKNHGYAPVEEQVASIRAGTDTRGSVRRKIGRPGGTGVFRDDGWYYVSTQIEHYTYNEPTVLDRRVVAILFDANDVVASVNQYGMDDGKVIDLETNTTPTYGRQLTIVEQLFSNIGAIPLDVFETE
ncbi:MAG: outer membrane protein assembly factor BamE [Pseudomonadota bacterium]